MFPAFPWKLPRGFPVKVTYKKSTKKNAKKYTKTYTCKTTVKNVAFSVKASTKTLKVGETSKLTVKKTPASANIKYSSSDPAVATVAKGVITANGVGKAVISAKFTYGTKKITKKITINVTEAVSDGVAVSLKNQFSADYPDTVLTWFNDKEVNDKALLRVYYGENNKGVKNENILVTYKYTSEGQNAIARTSVAKTDDNGVAYISMGAPSDGVDKVSYTITTERDKAIVKEGTVSFATISTSNVANVNGYKKDDLNSYGDKAATDFEKAGYAGLTVSANDKKGSNSGNGRTVTAGTATHKIADAGTNYAFAQYFTEYVNSQQVSSTGKTDHQVGFTGGLPYITLPADNASLNNAVTFQQDVNLTSGAYDTYATNSQYVTLSVNPNELTYATMNFTSLSLSKYTRLEIATYPTEADAKDNKNQIGSTTSVYGPSTQSSFAYQIPLSSAKYSTLCVKVTLVSKGQVNTDNNKGYVIKDITGVYKSKQDGKDETSTLLKGAQITWKAANKVVYTNETVLTSGAIALAAANLADDVYIQKGDTDTATKKVVDRATYRVPAFPYTGNAVITTYDKNGSVIAYYACPTENQYVTTTYGRKYNNTNDLVKNARYIYRISQEEAFNSVGTVTQAGSLVTVNSEKAGVTNLVGTITGVEGLDATNSTVYTSVQWNPVENATTAASGAIAFAGQEVTITAQLVDQNNNAVASAGNNINFKYVDGTTETSITSATGALNAFDGKKASVLSVENSTDSKGQAKLLVSAADAGTVIKEIQASTSNYNVVLSMNGETMKKLDMYWIEAKSAFTPSASNEGTTTQMLTDVTNECSPTIGENWEYGFETAKVILPGDGVWKNKEVTIKNAKIAVTAESGSKGTVKTDTNTNGMAIVTSNVPGKTTLVSTVDGSAYNKDGVTFSVKDVKDVKNVGTGTTAFVNTQKLEINWASTGVRGEFVSANGFNAISGSAFTMYFKVQDKLGNANTKSAVSVKSSDAGSIVSIGGRFKETKDSIDYYTANNNDGIIPIELKYNGNAKELVTVTVDGTAYTQVVTWKDAKAVALDTTTVNGNSTATSTDTWKTYADNTKIVLTFTQDILSSSVIADQFKVTREDETKTSEISSVAVSGKSIIITLKHPVTDGVAKDFKVDIQSATVDGVMRNVVTTNGDVLPTSSYTVGSSTSATAPR